MRATKLWAFVVLVACSSEPPPFIVTSAADGAPFYLTLTEIQREPAKSTLSVQGFHSRTAAGSRWLMCMYNELAVARGFKYWTVIYPEESTEKFPIALYQSPREDLRAILGTEYVAERAFPPQPTSTERWYETLCRWKKK